MKRTPNVVAVRIPAEVKGLFNWAVKYDERFKGKAASVVSYFFVKGILGAYNDALKQSRIILKRRQRVR